MGTLVCHMEYPASFFLACTNFSLGRTACRELAYTLCCPVLAETLKVAKKKYTVSWQFLAIVEFILVYICVWF